MTDDIDTGDLAAVPGSQQHDADDGWGSVADPDHDDRLDDVYADPGQMWDGR